MEVASAAGTGICRTRCLPAKADLNGSERSTPCEKIGFGRLWSEPSWYSSCRCRSGLRSPGVSHVAQISAVSGGNLSLGLDAGLRSNVNSLYSRQFSSKCASIATDLGCRKASHRGISSSMRKQRTGVARPRATGEQSLEASSVLEVDDSTEQEYRVGVVDLNQALEVLRQDVLYLDWRARHDVYAIKSAHDKLVEVLNPLVRDKKSVHTMRQQLAQLQEELSRAHTQVHLSESRVEHSLRKLAEMEAATSSFKTQVRQAGSEVQDEKEALFTELSNVQAATSSSKQLNVSGRVAPYPSWLKNFWYPVAFTRDIDDSTMIPIESFEEPWVLFRGKDGRIGCVRDECAHRACPLSLGSVVDGQIQCPYHGWEYSTDGECKKMPSIRPLKARIAALPCIARDGMVWIWPGDETPASVLPALNPPENFTIHAEIVLELPVEHGLLMENLLDLAHAPFTHTSTFAKGWPIPSFVKFKTPTDALRGHWDPYPIDMEFQPPCMVLSTIGLVKPGQLDGSSTEACPNHLHQLHVCMPSTRGKTRLLYRMALDFAQWAKYVPFVDRLWVYLANQVLNEDLRLVEGQQNRMERGANVWQTPVAYDKLGVRYRRWRNAVEAGNKRLPFDSM